MAVTPSAPTPLALNSNTAQFSRRFGICAYSRPNESARIAASELSLQLDQVPTVSIEIFEDRDDPIRFFARFLAE
jgi:hypothetical protein